MDNNSDDENEMEDDVEENIERPCEAGNARHRADDGSRRKWTDEECAAVRRQLKACILMHRVPKKKECELAIENEPVLSKREWKGVKFHVYNLIQKENKRQK